MFWGGPSLAVKTVKEFIGIPVNHVMVVGFQGFPRLVNAVGGVDMYVPQTVTTGAAGVPGRPARRHLQEGHAPLRRQVRDALRAHPHTPTTTSTAPRASRHFVQALQKKLAQAVATSPSCPRSASTS